MEWIARGLSALLALGLLYYTWIDLRSGVAKIREFTVSRADEPIFYALVIVLRALLIAPALAVAIGIVEFA